MQTVLSSLIVFIAAIYVANRWLPSKLKQRMWQLVGKSTATPPSGACGSCSSCGSCGDKQSTKRVIFSRSISHSK